MYKFKIITFLFLMFTFHACEDCECLDGDDDTNPPIEICDNGLLIMRSDGETGEPRFSLDSLSKPLDMPLVFQNIKQDQQDDSQFDVFNRPSNYDAYDIDNDVYYIEFPIQQRLYKYDIPTQTRQELIVAGFYSAPVFNNGNLYAITIDNFGYATDPANYEIEIIDQNNGTLTTIAINSFPLISSFNWESMSSATDNNDMIYFVSGTNLISYNIISSVASHTELFPEFSINNEYQRFYGLELRNNGNLLAIRSRDDSTGEGTELVEIDIDNPSETPTVVFDFTNNEIELNPEFYSTTYDVCDDTYYITSRKDAATTDFYEIDLSTETVKTENFDFYLMGVESKTN